MKTAQYFAQTFSETAPSGRTRSEQCFRYEVENTGTRIITQFYWPLAAINVDHLAPGRPSRVSVVRARPILDAPIDIDSKLFAIENEPALTRAFAERQYREGAINSDNRISGAPVLVKPDEALAGLEKFLQINHLPSEPFYTLYLKQGEDAPGVRDSYASATIQLDVRTIAYRKEQELHFKTVIRSKQLVTEQLLLTFPTIQAWKKTGRPLKSLADFSNFLSTSAVSKKDGQPPPEKLVIDWSVPTEAKSPIPIYRTMAPIFIFGKANAECFLITTYSPSPLSFDVNSCRRG